MQTILGPSCFNVGGRGVRVFTEVPIKPPVTSNCSPMGIVQLSTSRPLSFLKCTSNSPICGFLLCIWSFYNFYVAVALMSIRLSLLHIHKKEINLQLDFQMVVFMYSSHSNLKENGVYPLLWKMDQQEAVCPLHLQWDLQALINNKDDGTTIRARVSLRLG